MWDLTYRRLHNAGIEEKVFIATVNPAVGSWRLEKRKHTKIHERDDSNMDGVVALVEIGNSEFVFLTAGLSNRCSHPSLFQGEDSCNMDGFYDQQVPFAVPESVSFHAFSTCAEADLDAITFTVYGVRSLNGFVLPLLEMSRRGSREMSQRPEEEVHGHRAGSGHRRWAHRETSLALNGCYTFSFCAKSWVRCDWCLCCLAELFQDLSQLQEIWIAEGEICKHWKQCGPAPSTGNVKGHSGKCRKWRHEELWSTKSQFITEMHW